MTEFYVILKADNKRYRLYSVEVTKNGKFKQGYGELLLPDIKVPQIIFDFEIIGDLEVIRD